jgi:uncharacterized protein (TIGR03083 family)
LSPDQWAAPSLCAGWSVRDVAAHTLAYLDQSRLSLFGAYVKARNDVDLLNARGLARSVERSEVAQRMRDGADPSGAGALYGCRVALIECLIHQLDVRRPLRLPRPVPADAVRAALTFARISPVIRTPRGIRLVAVDVDWAAGTGPQVRGTGEALLLAMTGRVSAVATELEGDGVRMLRL